MEMLVPKVRVQVLEFLSCLMWKLRYEHFCDCVFSAIFDVFFRFFIFYATTRWRHHANYITEYKTYLSGSREIGKKI
jgi:hypothetical protein